MNPPPVLVCLGNLTIDDVVLPGGVEKPGCTGGDALYAALAARAWQPATELVAPVGEDFPQSVADRMRGAGLSDAGLARRGSSTLRNRVEYFADGRRVWTLFATDEEFELLSPLPDDIPISYRDAKGFMVLAMTLAAQQRLVGDLKASGKVVVALDPQEDYIKGNELALRKLIASVDIFLPSAEEVRQLLGHADWSSAARVFAGNGPAIVVIKLGADGCLVYDRTRDAEFRLPAFPVREAVDTTGAGDSFCGAFMAQYLRAPGDLKLAAKAGAVAASFAVSGYGLDHVFQVSGEAMRRRQRDWTT